MDDYLVSWISNYLTNRSQSVVLNGEISDPLPVKSGVPQGSVLGPLLFLRYINDVHEVVLSEGSKLILYADDIVLYRTIHTEQDYTALQHNVNSLGVWSLRNHLSFNPAKYKSISGVPRGVLRVLEHPHQLWHNSQFSSSVTNIITDNQRLEATTNNKLTGL